DAADPAQDDAALKGHERGPRPSGPDRRSGTRPIDRLMETGQIVIGQLCASTRSLNKKINDPGRIERMRSGATLASKTASGTRGVEAGAPAVALPGRAGAGAGAGGAA